MPSQTKSKVFEVAMADLEKKPANRVWPEDAVLVLRAGRAKGHSCKVIAGVLNTHFFQDNPVNEGAVEGKWRRIR